MGGRCVIRHTDDPYNKKMLVVNLFGMMNLKIIYAYIKLTNEVLQAAACFFLTPNHSVHLCRSFCMLLSHDGLHLCDLGDEAAHCPINLQGEIKSLLISFILKIRTD